MMKIVDARCTNEIQGKRFVTGFSGAMMVVLAIFLLKVTSHSGWLILLMLGAALFIIAEFKMVWWCK
jgi:membrane-bound ClpP family serine protease